MTRPARELPVSRRASAPVWAPFLAVGVVGLALGAGVGGGPAGPRVVLAVIGVVAAGLAIVALVRPPALVIDAQGLAFRTPFGERWRHRWADCGPFRAWRGDTVVWTNAGEAVGHPRRAAVWRRRADADVGVVAQFGGLSAEELARALNEYRSAG